MRKVKKTDIEALVDVINSTLPQGSTYSTCLDIDKKDSQYILQKLSRNDRQHPFFVGELDGQVICWASLAKYSDDYAFDGVAKLDICMKKEVENDQLYRSLLNFIEAQAKALGFYKIVISIVASKRAVINLYRTAGFRDVGIMKGHGYLKGELLDMLFMERLLLPNMKALREAYKENYPCYAEYFNREDAMQELQMTRNGMVRSPDDPDKWIFPPRDENAPDPAYEDWGGVTIRKVTGVPTLEELVDRQLANTATTAGKTK